LARAEIKALVGAAAAMGNNGLHSSRSGQHLFRLNKSFSMFRTQQLSFLEISLRHCFKSNFQRKGNSTVQYGFKNFQLWELQRFERAY
jgi:hypothetical protein